LTSGLHSWVWIKTKRWFRMYLNIIWGYIIIINKYLFGLFQYLLHNTTQCCLFQYSLHNTTQRCLSQYSLHNTTQHCLFQYSLHNTTQRCLFQYSLHNTTQCCRNISFLLQVEKAQININDNNNYVIPLSKMYMIQVKLLQTIWMNCRLN
jgi:hypothetical protein